MSDEPDSALTTVMAHQPTRLEDAWRLLVLFKGVFSTKHSVIDAAIEHLHKRGLPDPRSYSLEKISAKTYEDGLLRSMLLMAMLTKAIQLRQISEDDALAVMTCLNLARSHLEDLPQF